MEQEYQWRTMKSERTQLVIYFTSVLKLKTCWSESFQELGVTD